MPKKNKRPGKIKLWSVAVWLIIWQICALIIGQNILLVSPVTAFQRLFELACTGEFWLSITFSLLRIIGGFLATKSIAGGVLAAVNLLISILIYMPFVKVATDQYLKQEAAAEAAE